MKKAKFKALSNKGLVSASGKSLHRSHLHSLRTCISYEVRSILFLILKQIKNVLRILVLFLFLTVSRVLKHTISISKTKRAKISSQFIKECKPRMSKSRFQFAVHKF